MRWFLAFVIGALLVLIALLLIDTADAAETISTTCRSGFYGTTCQTVFDGDFGGSSPRVVSVAKPIEFNTDPNWGRGCRSCVDFSKPGAKQ